jgi:indole-3-glycerol phosphate synthase
MFRILRTWHLVIFLFPKLKEKLKRKTFATQKERNMAVIFENSLLHVFDAWLERCKTLIACNNDDFEKLRTTYLSNF